MSRFVPVCGPHCCVSVWVLISCHLHTLTCHTDISPYPRLNHTTKRNIPAHYGRLPNCLFFCFCRLVMVISCKETLKCFKGYLVKRKNTKVCIRNCNSVETHVMLASHDCFCGLVKFVACYVSITYSVFMLIFFCLLFFCFPHCGNFHQ